MTKKLEKQWWFELICCVGAVSIVQWLQSATGIVHAGFSFAALTVWFCCFYTIERMLSFGLWLLVLLIAPARVIGKAEPPR